MFLTLAGGSVTRLEGCAQHFTRLEGCMEHFSFGLPPLLNLIVHQKLVLIWFGVKLLQSSNIHQNKTKPLSEAFFGILAKRQRLFSKVPHLPCQ